MCGIAGVLAQSSNLTVLEVPLRAMREALRHRGPDDSGLYLSSSGKAGLAHTRLSILDPTPAGHQPMSSPDGRWTIVLNGEIYNFMDLRRELEGLGARFRTRSDTEVVLQLYERYGPECVHRLQGMYAFAIWDNLEESCFLARDPFGVKPLYLAATGSSLLFASELRAILASGMVERVLDPVGVAGYFQTGSVPEPATLVRGVEMLSPGSWLQWKNGETSARQWWEMRFPPPTEEPSSAPVAVRQALLDSVQRHFVSDVPVGAFLSGGMDSTAIVALSREVGEFDLRTFLIRFEDPEFDEGDLARRTAERFGTIHSERVLDATEGKALFERFLPCLDQPSIDGFNTFAVASFAKELGMKVVLSGLGGDELFGGYPSFRQVPRIHRWGHLLAAVPPLRGFVGSHLRGSDRPPYRRLGEFLQRPSTLSSAYRAFRGVFSAAEADVLAGGAPGSARAARDARSNCRMQPTLADEMSALELGNYMRNQLLRDSDVMSMAHGLELRVPFVDSALFERVALIPAAIRLRPMKKMLLEAVPEIPEWVWNRPKRGFHFPFDRWLGGEWRDLLESGASAEGVRTQTWYQKWSVFVFRHWCRTNGVSAE